MRILAGIYKGRKLLSPPASSQTRPLTALAKKSLFDILGDLQDAVVADLYCGSGTMGLEALSRGAGRCYFADLDRAVLLRLRRNIETLSVQDKCVIWQGDIFADLTRRLTKAACQIDVAFVDPPYVQSRRWDWSEAAERVFCPIAELLSTDGAVVVRLHKKSELPQRLGPLTIRRKRIYGSMIVALLGLSKQTK